MLIEWVRIEGFRNFKDALINFRHKSLVIGSNDVGKTNLLYAIRLLLDRSLSDANIEPSETDFHVQLDGVSIQDIKITIKLSSITEDAVLSRLKGWVNDTGESFLKYEAGFADLKHSLFVGSDEAAFEEIDSRSYLKYIHFRYIQSSRDLTQFIRNEKKDLLRFTKKEREETVETSDKTKEDSIKVTLSEVNEGISKLSYVADSTKSVNDELKEISHHHADYNVKLEAKAINFSNFIDQLSLGATTSNRDVGLGGDGRNNQILMALWKAKSEREYDTDDEAVIYCVEEPEAHLHPHQQRKMSKYLIEKLPGQVLISTHSPQITQAFRPDCIIRLFEENGHAMVASNGCSNCIENAWRSMGYRMSILPAEAFFSNAVFLVEGPSEVLFYHELARQLSIDLDFYNISILSVDGIGFKVYIRILDAMSIPWVMRTDNDVFKVQRSDPPEWRFAGLNRALSIIGKPAYQNVDAEWSSQQVYEWWVKQPDCLTSEGIYLAKVDLETDLSTACSAEMIACADVTEVTEAISYFQRKKALRMGEFLSTQKGALARLNGDDLAKPLHHTVQLVTAGRVPPPPVTN